MLGLFEYSYDYYEWETLVRISLSKESLILSAQEQMQREGLELVDITSEKGEALHKELFKKEMAHLGIREVEVI